jgi:hypothetical protein
VVFVLSILDFILLKKFLTVINNTITANNISKLTPAIITGGFDKNCIELLRVFSNVSVVVADFDVFTVPIVVRFTGVDDVDEDDEVGISDNEAEEDEEMDDCSELDGCDCDWLLCDDEELALLLCVGSGIIGAVDVEDEFAADEVALLLLLLLFVLGFKKSPILTVFAVLLLWAAITGILPKGLLIVGVI